MEIAGDSKRYKPLTLSLVIATVIIAISLAALLYFTAYWEVVGWLGLWVYAAVLIAISGGWILLMTRVGVERRPLKAIDFATVALFAALIKLVDFASMFAPGAMILWNGFPQVAAAILYYFPLGIVVATALRLSPKPGVAFTLFMVESIIGQVFFPNVIWFIRDIATALSLEAYYIMSRRGTRDSLTVMGLMSGIMMSCAATIFQMYTWAYWRPLFITLPAAISAGIMMAVGAFLGYAIGERASTVVI